jgi:hypothetical protein
MVAAAGGSIRLDSPLLHVQYVVPSRIVLTGLAAAAGTPPTTGRPVRVMRLPVRSESIDISINLGVLWLAFVGRSVGGPAAGHLTH